MRLTHQIAIQSGVPTLFYGEPGVGKSSSLMAFGAALNEPTEVVISSVREPSDFAGLPVLTEQGVILHAPSWAHRLCKAGHGILFLDEISTAAPAVQSALLRVVLDGVVGDLELPKRVKVVAACNPVDQAANGWDLAPPLANRFCHIKWRVDIEKWIDGMVSGFPTPEVTKLPDDWYEQCMPQARAIVASFIKARQALLLNLPKDESQMGGAWASPRSWTMAAQMLAACDSIKAPKECKMELIAGCVGEAPALEFVNWAEELDLPDPEFVLANPEKFKLPKRGDRVYACLSTIVAAVLNNNTPKRWVACWKVLALTQDEGMADVGASAAITLSKNRPPKTSPPPEANKFMKLLVQAGVY